MNPFKPRLNHALVGSKRKQAIDSTLDQIRKKMAGYAEDKHSEQKGPPATSLASAPVNTSLAPPKLATSSVFKNKEAPVVAQPLKTEESQTNLAVSKKKTFQESPRIQSMAPSLL